MSLHRRTGSPFWQYDFAVEGQRFRGSTGQEGKREAARFEADQREIARRSQRQRGDWTVMRLCETYYNDHGMMVASNATVFHQLAKICEHLTPTRKLRSITNATMMDYRTLRLREGLQPHSVNRDIQILRAAMRWCEKLYDAPIPKLAWDSLRTPEPVGRTRFLSFVEYDSLMLAAHPDLRPIIIAAVTTGLRKGNILRLDWRDVKLSEKVIQATVKGNKRHTVRIVPQLMAALSTTAPDDRTGKVFKCVNFEKRWRMATAAAALVDDLRFHDLRHTFASWARQSGADIADVFEALGHSDISMTMRYAHIKPDAQNTAFDRVSEALATQFTAQQKLTA